VLYLVCWSLRKLLLDAAVVRHLTDGVALIVASLQDPKDTTTILVEGNRQSQPLVSRAKDLQGRYKLAAIASRLLQYGVKPDYSELANEEKPHSCSLRVDTTRPLPVSPFQQVNNHLVSGKTYFRDSAAVRGDRTTT
jgi:hypothetical protein